VTSDMREIVRSVIALRTYVGHTAVAVTPLPATSAAIARIRPTAACFEAVYALVYRDPDSAAVEATITIRP
jgi:hypothetical protein